MMHLIKTSLCATVLFATLTASHVCSEIIYSGLLNHNGPEFAIDINNDGTIDFVAEWRTWAFGDGSSETGYDAVINSAMQYLNTGTLLAPDGFPGAKCPLNYGELIGPIPPQGLLWSTFSNDAMLWTTWNMSNEPFFVYSGEWHKAHDRYLGFEMRVGAEVFYGWIQLGVDAFNNVTLFGYAYENTPSTPIAAGAVPGAGTLFVRPDGGTASQCTGKVDAPYPGSGLHQPCAWSHPYWALRREGASASWKLEPGDTLIVASGSYKMGYGAPNTGWCSSSYPWDCHLPPLPSGLDPDHPTRLLGKGWDTGCTSPPQFWGTERALRVLDLTGTSDAVIACLEITDHSGCVCGHSNPATRCKREGSPYGKYADVGLYAADSARILVRDVDIHGLAMAGVQAGRLTDWTVVKVRLAANGWVGWDGDLWEDNSSNQGTLSFRRWLVEWNGCAETYPGKKPNHCWAQSAGGYGDGVGTAKTAGHWIIEDSVFRYNTSDGLDLLYVGQGHLPESSITIRRTIAQGNAGNQIKVNAATRIDNTLIVGNCGYFYRKKFAHPMGERRSGDHCRAGGGALALSLTGGDQVSVVNSTLVGQGDVLIGIGCDSHAACTSQDRVILANNILVGCGDFLQPGDKPAFVWVDDESEPPFPGQVQGDHNLAHRVKFSSTFPRRKDPNLIVADPLFVDSRLHAFNGHLAGASPAIDSGSLEEGMMVRDLDGVFRPQGKGVDRGAFEAPAP